MAKKKAKTEGKVASLMKLVAEAEEKARQQNLPLDGDASK